MVKYEGIFFDNKTIDFILSLEREKLEFTNDEIHCTFKYKPKDNEIFNDIVGKEYELEIIGYGCDGKSSGFEIKLPDELIPYYINYDEDNPTKLKKVHITASLSKDTSGKHTKDLDFKKLNKSYKIKGRFGFWIMNEDKEEYLSFEPISKVL